MGAFALKTYLPPVVPMVKFPERTRPAMASDWSGAVVICSVRQTRPRFTFASATH